MATTKKYISLDKLSLYDEKIKKVISDGDAAALSSAKSYADGLAVNYDSAGSAAAVQTKLDGEVLRAKAAEEANAGLANAAQADVDALETYVGTIPADATSTNVVAYVQEKTANIASTDVVQGLTDRVEAVEGEVDAIQADYLKAADKTELSNAIAAEKERAEGIEGGLETRLAAVEADYLKGADKQELQGGINTNADAIAAIKEDVDVFFANADMTESAKDTLKELQEYIASDETGASAMAASIKQNGDDIDAVEGRVGTLEGEMDTVEGKVSTIEGNITTLQGEDTAIKGRLDAIESTLGESGSVAGDIATAKQEAIDAAAADATSKANTAESNAKTYADGLNTSMNSRVEALEAIDHSHANQAELDLIASGDKAKWDAAAAKAHEHENKTVIDAITEAKVTAWDTAEGNSKTYADGLNTAMDTRMTAVETGLAAYVEVSEEDINGLFA